MAKDLTRHQEGIVKRYYEHQETTRSNRLSDLVAEIWLCEDPKKATKLWGHVQVALMKAGCNATLAAKVVGNMDTEALAKLVQEIDAGRTPTAGGGGAPAGAGGESGGATAAGDDSPKLARGAQSVADGRSIEQMKREKAAAGGYDSLEEGNLKRAMNAFRRKLKNIRRDDESQIRGRYVTRGEASKIVAISPPYEFPPAVWQELARLGRLKHAGQGTYQLP
ncbi:MAG: hypothetical protein WD534_06855 [Phycisphaeraceae bacterium]